MPSRELLQQVAAEVVRAYPEVADRARDGSRSAEYHVRGVRDELVGQLEADEVVEIIKELEDDAG